MPANEHRYLVTTSPHIHAEQDVGVVMRWVCLALAPAYVWSVYRFGYWPLGVAAIAVAACVLTEAACQRLRRQTVTVNDWSAVVTGLLLAAVLPPNVAWYIPAVGGLVAIGVAKQAFGGLGANIWNPALLSRAFLQLSFGAQINSGRWPMTRGESVAQAATTSLRASFEALAERADVITQATPLEALMRVQEAGGGAGARAYGVAIRDGGLETSWQAVLDAFLGNIPGCIGEVSALALLAGAALLLARRIITWHIPVAYLGTLALLGWALPAPYAQAEGARAFTDWFTGPALYHLVAGGAVIGACFMATDMVTSPITRRGQLIFGVGCGLLTALIRIYGGYPEGVCYSILLMNMVVPLIDGWTRPRVLGKTRKETGP